MFIYYFISPYICFVLLVQDRKKVVDANLDIDGT